VWDLVNTSENYDFALPTLLVHLQFDYPDEILEGIARAMAVCGAAPFRPELIQLLRGALGQRPRIREGLAIAIAGTTTSQNVRETLELARDRTLGIVRVLLLRPLRRSRKPEIRQAIVALSEDPDLAKEISSWGSTRRRLARETRQ
jgi:hypothetical protein